ncbi:MULTISPECIES: ATP-binding protein [Actinotignum]|uniref:ATP-binding protein n=3 Tax=Actinotignum timonense TaxID=1870995 RepID=A0AAW9HR83_9ACTO|nr:MULTISPECIES: ATP-binding protein [Actinotignum]MDE1558362.1 ATP-binding protein [Actinotignum schaalii]MDE1663154.1 ATP-binding protein [Actinotignum schaalii]MDK6372469.1 ATP-binding protein [Actinotignum timonense]MDK6419329.1 ATP-binding protein [Actinotignum timonense]MDK6590708.1 ATP-binding protein [Actinotignum timonense]
MRYHERAIDKRLDALLPEVPAIAIDGAKGVGKTATALQRANTVWLLDRPETQYVAAADPDFTTVPPGTLLLDEWQKVPAVWDSVRRQVDGGAPAGRFLLTGSAMPFDASGLHSGAGRVFSLRLRPMALFERELVEPSVSFGELLRNPNQGIAGHTDFALPDYCRAIARSGFPGIMTKSAEVTQELLDSYLRLIIDRDLPDYGATVRRPEVLHRWLAAYAAASSLTTSYANLLDATTGGDGTQPAKSTTITYREHLTALWILDPIPGWAPAGTALKRLQLAPKHQLADPALALRLLNLNETTLLGARGQKFLGQLFESLAALSVRVAAEANRARVFHLRTRNGDHEVDLIAEGPSGEIAGVEVKLANAISEHDVQHLLWLRKQIPEHDPLLMVLNTGAQAYRRPDGIYVIPLALLGA